MACVIEEPYAKISANGSDANAAVPASLYHTILTVVDYNAKSGCAIKTAYPLGTHTTASAAKDFSRKALKTLGYAPSDFESYEEHQSMPTNAEVWKHGDDVVVYARRAGLHELLISITTALNNEGLPADPTNPTEVKLPDGAKHLHYVMQTKPDITIDPTGIARITEIEATFVNRVDAMAAARKVLISGELPRKDYAQYDEWDGDKFKEGWPFGEEVVVHAIAPSGEHYDVAVRTITDSHAKHAKRV